MVITPEVEARVRRYLLGDLPPDEALALESNYFEDDELFDSVQIMEDELVRDFLKGEMAPDLRQRFELRYSSSPELIKKIEFARAVLLASENLRSEKQPGRVLPAAADKRPSSTLWDFFRFRVSLFQYATVIAGLAIGWFGLFMWTENSRLKLDLARVQNQNKSLADEKSLLSRALSERPKEPLLVASFILSPGVSRSDGASEPLVVPAGIGQVDFKVPLPSGVKYQGYRAVLQRLPSGQVSSQDLPPSAIVDSGRALIVGIPSVSLKAGRYVLYAKGRNERGEYEDVQYYAFAVAQ